MDLLQAQLEARQAKKPYALVTLVKAEGAAPRGAGSKMIVFENGHSFGTVGGGTLEKKVLADAVKCLRDGRGFLKDYENRAEEEGSPCIGVVTVFIEPEKGAPHLVVCGAGHVGGAVIELASKLGYYVTVIDTRDEELTAEHAKNADSFIVVEDFYSGLRSLDTGPKTFFLVLTYGHAEDAEALSAALEKDAAYIGMTGSRPKIESIFTKLKDKGFTDEQLAFIHTPVGLDIGGETPPEIALSIMAEMQMTRYGRTGRESRER